ncbi:MAG: pseudaminic acid cytidylyltransferase [Lachnospiraceae bacterium]|nr:pseudaminic acid cytidylyltransferase [Lachnospiraceae bacterium]
MSKVCIITARGGSKRIPGKNIKDFLGKPIIAYSIEAALNSGVFDEVMVSTDSAEIAEIAKAYGAKVPFVRSDENANDFAVTRDVCKVVIESYRAEGKVFDLFACVYPTAPFLTAEKLKAAVETLEKSDAYSLVPVVQFSFPPQRGVVVRDGLMQFMNPEFAQTRSQDLEPVFHDVGQFYIEKTEKFLEEFTLVTSKTVPFVLPEEEVQDIDNYSDWAIAEMKYKLLHDIK